MYSYFDWIILLIIYWGNRFIDSVDWGWCLFALINLGVLIYMITNVFNWNAF